MAKALVRGGPGTYSLNVLVKGFDHGFRTHAKAATLPRKVIVELKLPELLRSAAKRLCSAFRSRHFGAPGEQLRKSCEQDMLGQSDAATRRHFI